MLVMLKVFCFIWFRSEFNISKKELFAAGGKVGSNWRGNENNQLWGQIGKLCICSSLQLLAFYSSSLSVCGWRRYWPLGGPDRRRAVLTFPETPPPSLPSPPLGVGGGVQRGVTGVAISLTSLSSHYKHGPQPGSPAPPLSLGRGGRHLCLLRSSKWGIMRINRPCALHLLPSPSSTK